MITGSLGVVSNREDWDFEITVIDKDTSEAIDISAATEIVISVRRQGDGSPEITSTIGDGVTLSATTGVFDWHVDESTVHTLIAGTYDVGMRSDIASAKKSIFVGTIAVLDGVVE